MNAAVSAAPITAIAAQTISTSVIPPTNASLALAASAASPRRPAAASSSAIESGAVAATPTSARPARDEAVPTAHTSVMAPTGWLAAGH